MFVTIIDTLKGTHFDRKINFWSYIYTESAKENGKSQFRPRTLSVLITQMSKKAIVKNIFPLFKYLLSK